MSTSRQKQDQEFPRLEKGFQISEEIKALSFNIKVDPKYITDDPIEQIRLDDQAKWEYLTEKYGLKSEKK